MLRGRVFTLEDRLASQRVAVINQSLAQRMFPGEDPVGRTIVSTGELETRATIVGVAGDTVHFGLEEKQTMQVYVPLPQLPFIFGSLMVKTELPPMSMASAVRAAVWQVDKDQPVWKVRSLETLVDNRIAYRRFMAWFVGAFSAFALLLASLGIYGVLSHWVSLRTREIGVRVALGARPQEVARLILRQGAVIVLLGVAVGVVAAVAAGQAIRTLLFGVTGADPFTLAAVAVLLLLVGLAACYLPARRALTVDPAQVLRLD